MFLKLGIGIVVAAITWLLGMQDFAYGVSIGTTLTVLISALAGKK